jgi:hypothetical protein
MIASMLSEAMLFWLLRWMLRYRDSATITEPDKDKAIIMRRYGLYLLLWVGGVFLPKKEGWECFLIGI